MSGEIKQHSIEVRRALRHLAHFTTGLQPCDIVRLNTTHAHRHLTAMMNAILEQENAARDLIIAIYAYAEEYEVDEGIVTKANRLEQAHRFDVRGLL